MFPDVPLIPADEVKSLTGHNLHELAEERHAFASTWARTAVVEDDAALGGLFEGRDAEKGKVEGGVGLGVEVVQGHGEVAALDRKISERESFVARSPFDGLRWLGRSRHTQEGGAEDQGK